MVHFMQEMKFHGIKMDGPAKTIKETGCSGKFKGNVQRDILRKVSKIVPC